MNNRNEHKASMEYASPQCFEVVLSTAKIMELSISQGNNFGEEENW